MMTNKKPFLRAGEFKARLPYLDKIPTDVLKTRLEMGVGKMLALVSGAALVVGEANYSHGGEVKEAYKLDARNCIASCNYSASQVAKELKARGVKIN